MIQRGSKLKIASIFGSEQRTEDVGPRSTHLHALEETEKQTIKKDNTQENLHTCLFGPVYEETLPCGSSSRDREIISARRERRKPPEPNTTRERKVTTVSNQVACSILAHTEIKITNWPGLRAYK